MKRLLLSLALGFTIPFLYVATTGPLSTYVKNDTLNWLGYIPIGWPKLILMYFIPLDSFPFRDEDSTALLLYIVGCNVVLYASLTYFLLLVLAKRKEGGRLPPGPEQFV